MHEFALFEAILLIFVYDNLDILITFSRLAETNFSYLKDKAFWTYFGSRGFLSSIVWIIIVTQQPTEFLNDMIMGLTIFLLQIGFIQNFGLRFGKYDLNAFEKFSKIRQKIIANMESRIRQLQARRRRELQVGLEEYSIEELKKHIHNASALKNTSLTQTQKEIDELEEKLIDSGLRGETLKPYLAAKVIEMGGVEFAEGLINENRKTEKS